MRGSLASMGRWQLDIGWFFLVLPYQAMFFSPKCVCNVYLGFPVNIPAFVRRLIYIYMCVTYIYVLTVYILILHKIICLFAYFLASLSIHFVDASDEWHPHFPLRRTRCVLDVRRKGTITMESFWDSITAYLLYNYMIRLLYMAVFSRYWCFANNVLLDAPCCVWCS